MKIGQFSFPTAEEYDSLYSLLNNTPNDRCAQWTRFLKCRLKQRFELRTMSNKCLIYSRGTGKPLLIQEEAESAVQEFHSGATHNGYRCMQERLNVIIFNTIGLCLP